MTTQGPVPPAPAALPSRRRPADRLLYPALVAGPPLAAAGLMGWAGVDPAAAMTVAVLVLIALVTALERHRPFRAAWNPAPRAERVTDVAYIALASVPDRLTRVGVEVAVLAVLGWERAPLQGTGPAPWAGALAAFLLADLGKYAVHRASHHSAWLWRFHQAHHQPQRLVALNALRLHPVNTAYNAAVDALAMLLFGVSAPVAGVLGTLRATVGVLQHANLDVESGTQWLFNAPSWHRIHHAADAPPGNHNHGSTLLVWDRLFGTLRRAPAPDRVGVAPGVGPVPPRGLWGQLWHPWCGDRLGTTCVWARFPWMVR